jgi:hypothetical protein
MPSNHPDEEEAIEEARWATDPERIDPDDYPPLRPFARAMTWADCAACATQVHTIAARFLVAGIVCPDCGARLLDAPADGAERLRALLRQEDELSEQIE